MELILDSNRNALLALDLKISILTMGIGIGTLIAGIFGMNVRLLSKSRGSPPTHANVLRLQLKSRMEEHEYMFYVMAAAVFAASLGGAWIGVHRCVLFHGRAVLRLDSEG